MIFENIQREMVDDADSMRTLTKAKIDLFLNFTHTNIHKIPKLMTGKAVVLQKPEYIYKPSI